MMVLPSGRTARLSIGENSFVIILIDRKPTQGMTFTEEAADTNGALSAGAFSSRKRSFPLVQLLRVIRRESIRLTARICYERYMSGCTRGRNVGRVCAERSGFGASEPRSAIQG